MTKIKDLQPGDVVTVVYGSRYRNDEEAVIAKRGRKYFTVGEGWSATQYHIDTGHIKGGYSGQRITTAEQLADERRREALIGELREAGVQIEWRAKIATEQLEQIALIVRPPQ